MDEHEAPELPEEHGCGPAGRLTPALREAFLDALRASGNACMAAAEIGRSVQHLRRVRRRDPGFARSWAGALRESTARLARRPKDLKDRGDGSFETIRRCKGGRLQIAAHVPGKWSKKIEDRFIALLTVTGNFSAAARAIEVRPETIFLRRRRWPLFARRIEEALEDSEILLQFRLVSMGNDVGHSIGEQEQAEDVETRAAAEAAQGRFDPHLALQFLKWREEKRNGGRRRGRPLVKRRSIDEVTDDIVRKAEAIRRHEERKRGGSG